MSVKKISGASYNKGLFSFILHVFKGELGALLSIVVTPGPRLIEKLPSGLLQVVKAEGKRTLAIKCISLEVTHGNSAHNSLTRMITWSLPNHKEARKYKPAVCQAGGELEIYGEQHE